MARNDKEMVKTSKNTLRPSTDFGGSQVKDYSSDQSTRYGGNTPGSFKNLKSRETKR